MNTKSFSALALVASAIILASAMFAQPRAAENQSAAQYEYGTISWDGDDDTHFIRPNGDVEFLGSILKNAPIIDRADERDHLMNYALNHIAKEGFELVSMESNVYIVRRPVL